MYLVQGYVMHQARHSIAKNDLILYPNEYRIVLILRHVKSVNVKEAFQHYMVCKNDETKCSCKN